MSLLKPATNNTRYLKVGIFGFEGSGKTHTAFEIIKGLTKLEGKKKIAFWDSEKGSDFHVERLRKEGLELHVIKSRSFQDLLGAIKEAEQGDYGGIILDSVTHAWRDLCDSYLAAKKERIKAKFKMKYEPTANLHMKDWSELKAKWFLFSDLFVNSNIHIVSCGRAGFEYNMTEDDEGKQEISKTGTKMKAEGEFGYESDLLLEMLKVPLPDSQGNKQKGFTNQCIVLKDRNDLMNGAVLFKPKFDDFKPIISQLAIGEKHIGVEARDSKEMFAHAGTSVQAMNDKMEIALDSLQEFLILKDLGGTSNEVKKKRTEALIQAFGTSSQKALENMAYQDFLNGLEKLKQIVNGEPLPPEQDKSAI